MPRVGSYVQYSPLVVMSL